MEGHLLCFDSDTCYPLDRSPFYIGRNREADIKCRKLSVSRFHCELHLDKTCNIWSVHNKSPLGTFINEKKFTDTVGTLSDGDVLRVGEENDQLTWVFATNCCCRPGIPKPTSSAEHTDKKNEVDNLKIKLALLAKAFEAKEQELAQKKLIIETERNDHFYEELARKEQEKKQLAEELEMMNCRLDLLVADGAQERERTERIVKTKDEEICKLREEKDKIEQILSNVVMEKLEAEGELKAMAASHQQVSGSASVPLDHVEEILETELQCSICSELFITAMTLNCTHTVCRLCLMQWKKKICPICRAHIVSENRSLVLDNYIDKMVQNLSEDFKVRRAAMVSERKKMEEELQAQKMAQEMYVANRGRRSRGRGRGGFRRRPEIIFIDNYP